MYIVEARHVHFIHIYIYSGGGSAARILLLHVLYINQYYYNYIIRTARNGCGLERARIGRTLEP